MVRPSPMRTIVTAVALLASVLASPAGVRGDIYRYEDPAGVLHFTDTPTHKGFKVYMRTGFFNVADYRDYFRRYDRIIAHYADVYGVAYPLVKAVIKAESGYNPKATSRKGAKGLMQLMPATADAFDCDDPYDPESNIGTGIRYLRYLNDLYAGDLRLMLAGYNAGPGNVAKYGRKVPPFPETKAYVSKVLAYYDEYRQQKTTKAE